jgi:hypothetical protein
MQIIDGEDLTSTPIDLIAERSPNVVDEHCPTEFAEDWDLKGLVAR